MSDFINIDALADAIMVRLGSRIGMTEPEPLAFTVEQAARRLNMGESTLRQMIRDRELVVVRRGTKVLITRQSLVDWLEAHAA